MPRTSWNTFVLLSCFICTACQQYEHSEKKASETFEAAFPLVKDMPYTNEYVAVVHSVRYVEVRSKVKGYIEKIHVDEGQKVREGQPLFSLNSLEFEKELQKANALHKNAIADLKAAEVDLSNVKRLAAKDIVAKSELEVALAKVDALKADVEEAQAHKEKGALELSYTRIKAPYHGVINRIPNKVGSLISEGTMLTSISDNSEVFAYFNLSEIDYLNFIVSGEKALQNVNLKMANNVLYPYPGKVETIESEFDPLTGNIAFRARFPNPYGILKHGSNGKIIVSKQLKNALLVPQKSTLEIQDKLYVFVVDKDGAVSQRNIIPKMRFTDFFAVESGLAKDEQFLVEGVEKVREGMKIKAVPADIAALMAASNTLH